MTPTTATAKFQLDTSALVPATATEIEISSATSADVLAALATNQKFPDRQIDLGSISLKVAGDTELQLGSAASSVTFAASAGADLQLGIFDKASDVLARLALEDADEIGLEIADLNGTRYVLFSSGYALKGTVSGVHPIGVLGAVTFGVEGQRRRRYAVVQRFAGAEGAHDVLSRVFSNVKLPRHVTEASKLSPSTHLITEVDGSVALQIATQLGYDFNFVREARALGLQGDIGLRIEAGVKAFIGFEVSGRFLLVLERPSADDSLRLRMFKLRKKGLSFGLNISSKVQPVVDILPESSDDLVKAVFGVHGQQVVRDLKLIEQWTDPNADLSDMVAGLASKAGVELLEKATGFDAHVKFNEARAVVLGAIAKWEALPSTVSSLLWAEIEGAGLSGSRRDSFERTLRLLASADPATRKQELMKLLSKVGMENDLAGRFLIAASDRGLAALLDKSEELRRVASITLDLLNGQVMEKLQDFIVERLDLQPVLDALTAADFDDLDDWLVERLSALFDEKLRFEHLDQVKDAINLVITKRQEIYAKARQALTRRYDFDVALRYQTSGATTALLDATFDTSQPPARNLLKAITENSKLDDLLTTPTAGVTLATAVLTHEITRQSSVEVHLPYYDSSTTTLTQSLAKVTAQEDGGRVLFYELTASDAITKNRLRSQLALSASMVVRPGARVRVHGHIADASWSYQFLQIAPNLRRKELEERITPLVFKYFPDHFPGGTASLSGFLTDFDRAVEDVVHNGTDEFGDLLLSLEVSVPDRVTAAWFRSRTKEQARAAARAASLRIQRALQDLIPFYHFRDLDRLHQNLAAASLLVFSSLPPVNAFRIENGKAVPENGPIWDVFDPFKRAFIVNSPQTAGRLGSTLASQRARLLAAGRTSQAEFFKPEEVDDFLAGVSDHPNFVSLLRLVSLAADGVESALDDLRKFEEHADTRPSQAVKRLAEFSADIVSTFNKDLSSIYGGDLLRPLGSLVFVEAACALDSTMVSVRPNALLALTVLKEQRTYQMDQFLVNQPPPIDQIAVQQRLVAG